MARMSITLVAATAAAAMLAGCAGASPAPTSTTEPGGQQQPQEQVNLRMWTFLNPTGTSGREVALKEIIDKFEADNPNIKMTVEPQTWDVMTGKFFAAHQAKNAPDVIWVLQDELGAAIKLNALEPLENLFLADWSAQDIADIDDAFWQQGATQNQHFQVTHSRNYFGIFYRKDLFEEKGIAVPKTWDELIAAATALTETDASTGIQRYGFGQALSVDKADAGVAAAGMLDLQGSLFTDAGEANWANDNGKQAFQLAIDLIEKHKVTPSTALTMTAEDLYKDFSAGKYAMIQGAGVRMANLQTDATFDPADIGFMLYPSFDGQNASPTPVAGWSVGVWSGGEHKQEAGKVLEAMRAPEADALGLTKGGQVPIRKSTITAQADFLADPLRSYLTVMAEGFATAGWAQPTDFALSAWRGDFNTVAQEVLANGATLDDALAKTAKAFNDRNVS